ncbi:hypothetical protein GH714_022506 [Hevea brasiliensis]|uniref:STAS domain-containing protein n=1 Tax=Hevea brasiliensis TaxID=3981 RepID=A0A6A6LJX3_HEVBR|nr:hypothetical protein GH714_022506 [Hevea brasiliensis]
MGVNSNRVEDFSSHETALRINTEAVMPPMIHSVCPPPQQTTLQKLKLRLGEIFFPDDPLYRFKNQTLSKKLVLGLQFLFPIFQWGPEYSLKLFRESVMQNSNLPPIVGLYSSFVPPLIYSILGSSRHLGVGPVSIASLVMGSMLSEAVSPTEDQILYLKLAFTATFFAGVFQASLGLLSHYCFTATAKRLLGIVHFTSKMQFVPVMSSVFNNRDEWSWQTIVIGFGFLVFLLTTRHISMKKPKLFWVSAAAPLTSVIISTLLVFCLKSKIHGVSIIGHLPKGLNPPSANMLYFNGSYLAVAIKTGIVNGILSLTEGIAVGRTFAALKNYQVDGNKEMMAIGLMNVAGSCSSCYYNRIILSICSQLQAGAQTALSNIVMASAVLVTVLFLMPLFYYTPNVILAAIIITAVIGLIDYQAAYQLWKVDKLDFLACLCSFFGVLFISVPLGLAIAVGVSVLKILLHVTRPNTVVMGNIPGTQIYQSLSRYREALRVPSFLMLAIESPIYFANSTYLQERILRWVREEEERIKANNGSALKCIILDMTAVTAIDTSGIELLCELRKMMEKRSLQLVLTNPVGSVMEKLQQSKVLESFGLNGLYLTVEEAIADISALWKSQP